MVWRYAELQDKRESDIKEQKAIAEAEREKIFEKLKEEEKKWRAEMEYIENLRNELQQQEYEEMLREKERREEIKRDQDKQDLLRAKAY